MSTSREEVEAAIARAIEFHERKAELLRQYLGDGGISPPTESPATKAPATRVARGQTGDIRERAAVVLAKDGPMKLTALIAEMKKGGWSTASEDPRNIVYQAIKNDDRFEQVKRGTWKFNK